MFLFTLILTATLFFSCSDNDKKARSIPFPEKFHGTWVETGINNSDLGADTLIIDIDENTFEVRGYAFTNQVFALKFVLTAQNDDTFFLKNIEQMEGEEQTWSPGYGAEEIGYKLVGDKDITITMPDGVGNITMQKTEFTQLEVLKETWENSVNSMVITFTEAGYTYTENGYECSGTWNASEDTIDSFDGIIRTVMTKEDGVSGLSYGSASPYKLNENELSIWYPDDDDNPQGLVEVKFTK